MNKFFSLLAAAFVFTTASASATTTPLAHDNTSDVVTLDNATQVSYTVTVLALDDQGNRAFNSSKHRNLTQAHMAYQAFVFELPDGSEVVQAEIVDSDGEVILSIG